jgi:hypothetical protein
MSEIWMQPTEMRGIATAIGQQSVRIRDAITGACTACACDVPRSLVGWVDDELMAITEDALRAVVGYLQEAVDTMTRADQIAADQSLVASQATFGAPAGNTVWSPVAAPTVWSPVAGTGPGVFFPAAAGVDPERARTDQMVLEQINNQSPLMPSFVDVISRTGDGISTILAPSGLTFSNGSYVDSGGDRSTSLAGEYRDPVTGKYDI